jgi:predicted permease
MSLRRALGASRARLARQVLVESLLLSGVGAALGLMFAGSFSRMLVRQASTEVNRFFLDTSLDWRVLAFTAAAAFGTTLVFGLAPAFRAARTQPNDALKEGSRGHVGGRRWELSQVLIVGQVAFSVVLVVSAGLFVRTFATLATMDVGFDRERTVIFVLNAQDARVPPANRPLLYERVRQAAAAVPGVEGAVTLLSAPASQDHWIANVLVVGQTPPVISPRLGPFLNAVSPDYFATFGAPILAGRGFTDRDRQDAPLVAVVNESFARLFIRGHNPVGETLTFLAGGEDGADHASTASRPSSPPFQIVGLAKDSGSAVNYALREGIPPTVYFCIGQMNPAMTGFAPPAAFRIGVRVANSSARRDVAAAINRVEPDLRITVRTMADYIDRNLVTERLTAVLSGLFGSLALVLAGVGIFGVTAYAVSRRRAEFGVRIALGASTGDVVRTVLQRVVILVGLGLAIGGAVSFWTSRLVAALLFRLEPRDPATFAGTAVVLAAVALLAGWLPARRAARIDPAIVLRNE